MKEVRRFRVKAGTQPYSRYRNLDRIVYDNGVEEVDQIGNVVIPRTTTDQYFVVDAAHENRLDLIAFEYYNTPRLWWVIAYASGIIDPFTVPAGTKLRIPPLSVALSSEVV